MTSPHAAHVLLVAGLLSGVSAAPALAQSQPSDPYYEFLIARHLEGEGDNPGALAALERAAAADTSSAEIRAEIASFYMRRNQRTEAEKAARDAVALDADNFEGNRVLGMIAASNADNERLTPPQVAAAVRDAVTYLERAVAASPGFVDPNINFRLGQLYLRSGDLDKATQALGRVLLQNPDSAQVRLSLAQTQALNKDLPGAILTLQEGVDAEPRLAAMLGQYQEEAGQFKDAAETFTRALTVQPASRELKTRRILALYEAKDFAGAAAFAAEAQQQHPDDPRFPRLGASALWFAGEQTPAITLLEAAVKRFPDDDSSRLALADLYADTDRPADAERMLRDMLTANPDNADALNYLGYMLANRGERLDEAISLVGRALARDPGNGAYLDSLGWAHFRKGNFDEAEKYLTAAAERMPGNAEVLDHLGDLHAKRDRWQDAIVTWEKALAGDDADVDRAAIEKKLQDARTRAR